MGRKARLKRTREEIEFKSEPVTSPTKASFLPVPSIAGQGFLVLVLVYGVGVLFRCMGMGPWLDGTYQVNGEMLLTTNDAYAWMAGAIGTGRYAGGALSEFLALIHNIFGFKIGNIAFWTPVFTAPLVAVPIIVLGYYLDELEAGFTASIWAVLANGYLARTTFGYYRQDILVIFFLACLIVGLIICLDKAKKAESLDEAEGNKATSNILVIILCLGLFAYVSNKFYPNAEMVIFSIVMLSILLAWLQLKGKLQKIVIIGFVSLFIFPNIFILALLMCGALMWCVKKHPDKLQKHFTLLFVLVLIVASFSFPKLYDQIYYKIIQYGKLAPSVSVENSLSFPNASPSVAEADSIGFDALTQLLGGNFLLFILGITSFGAALYKRHYFFLFTPLLLLGLSSLYFGIRFTMYGGIAISIGFGFGINIFLHKFKQGSFRRWMTHAALAAVLIFASYIQLKTVNFPPVCSVPFARTLIELKSKCTPDGLLWVWWDYGYAAQYYANCDTIADGSRHNGPRLFIPAKVFSSDSPQQANQIMKFATQDLKPEAGQRINFFSPNQHKTVNYEGDVGHFLRTMKPALASKFLDELKTNTHYSHNSTIKQYLIVYFGQLSVANAIYHFATWDLEHGKGRFDDYWELGSYLNLTEDGHLQDARGVYPVSDFVLLDKDPRIIHHGKLNGYSFVVNNINRIGYGMSNSIFNSNLVSMLYKDPELYKSYFKIVIDNKPFVRVYELI